MTHIPRASTLVTCACALTAGLIVALMLIPAETWSHPVDDQIYRGFDPKLIYATDPNAIHVTADQIDISARANSAPAVNLVTTSLPRFIASFDVLVVNVEPGASPLRVGVWSPWTREGFFVTFASNTGNVITAESRASGTAGTTLIGGDLVRQEPLGHFSIGDTYHITTNVDRSLGSVRFRVSSASTGVTEASEDAAHLPGLFSQLPVSLTGSAYPGAGASRVVIKNYTLELTHGRSWAVRVNDPRVDIVLIILSLAALCLVGVAILGYLRRSDSWQRWLRPPSITRQFSVRSDGRYAALVVAAAAIFLVGTAAVFMLGSHPFDMGNEELYAYIARTYGPDQLYFLPNVVSLAKIWGGVPYSENAFPYGPIAAYLFDGIGWLGSLLFGGGGPTGVYDVRLEYLIKAINVLFGLADGTVIYLIMRRLGTNVRSSVIVSALFLFNPAVWFSMAVWGQNHVVSLFFVLTTILFIETRRPMLAWLALIAACLTRPQMLVFGLLLGIVILRKFHWQANLSAMSWATIIAFLVLVPLMASTSPSLPVDTLVANVRSQEADTNGPVVTTVSQDAYSIWPLVTYVFQGASGLERSFTPTSTPFLGPLTYLRASQFLTLGAILILSVLLVVRRRVQAEPGGYLPIVALGITSFLMLQTGVVATHFLLALPLLLLCRPWMSPQTFVFVATVWTITTLVPMYGDLGIAISGSESPLLAPARNVVTRFFVHLYSWDRFITLGVVANVCAVVLLAAVAVRRTSGRAPSVPAAS